jgi:hypothetical protein
MGGMDRKGGTGRTVRTVTVKRLLAAGVAALTTISGSVAAQTPAPKKVEIVSVTGGDLPLTVTVTAARSR